MKWQLIIVSPVQSYWHFPKSKTAAATILDFQVVYIWPFRHVNGVWCLSSMQKFGSNICDSHRHQHTYALDVHIPIKFGVDICIHSRVIKFFPKFKMAAAAILDFQFMWIWPFRRVDSVVFVFCTKCGSNVCYIHWDRHTYASDFHLVILLNSTLTLRRYAGG